MTVRERSWLLPPATMILIAGILVGRLTPVPWLALFGCIPLILGIVLVKGRVRFIGCLLLAMSLGVVSGSIAWHPDTPPEGEYEVRGIISDEIRTNLRQVRIDLSDVTLDGKELSAGAYWTFYLREEEDLPADLRPGRMVSFRASVYDPPGAANPDGYDLREDLLRRGITVGVYGCKDLEVSDPSFFSFAGFAASLRHQLTEALVSRMGEETGAYTAALLLGQRSLVPSEDRAAFSRLGIAHILSVSGFHVGILVGILGLVFRLLRLRPGLRFVLYALFLAFYCALCGMNQPVIRASLLLLVSFGGKLLNRPRIGLHSLCAVLFFMLLFSPVQLTGVSFLLTFSAVLGLTLVTPGLARHNPFRRRIPRRLWEAASVVIGAHLGILLPELYFYQQLPLLGLVLSPLITAFASVLIVLDWMILLLLWVPGLSGVLCGAGSAMTSLMTDGVRRLGELPGITLWTPAPTWITVAGFLLVFIALCAMLRLSRKFRAALLAAGVALAVFSFFPSPHTATEYIQFSVGNADAAVLWDRDYVLVMDAGLDDGVASGFLRRRRLIPDAVILTHLHADHVGGLRSMLDDGIPVRLVYLPAGAEDQLVHEDVRALLDELRASGTEIRYLGKGDVLELPSGSLTVLWPEYGRTRPNQDANHYALVSLLRLRGVTMLQASDITGEYEMYSAVPADILKAPHHGSSGSSFPEYLAAVSPQVVVLSCGREARHEDYAGRLPEGTSLYSTALSGALTLRFTDGAVTVVPFIAENSPSP